MTPYTLSFNHQPGYLYVRINCSTDSEQDAACYLAEIAGQCQPLKAERLLLDFVMSRLPAYERLFYVFRNFE
jgi:hypothetical protein